MRSPNFQPVNLNAQPEEKRNDDAAKAESTGAGAADGSAKEMKTVDTVGSNGRDMEQKGSAISAEFAADNNERARAGSSGSASGPASSSGYTGQGAAPSVYFCRWSGLGQQGNGLGPEPKAIHRCDGQFLFDFGDRIGENVRHSGP